MPYHHGNVLGHTRSHFISAMPNCSLALHECGYVAFIPKVFHRSLAQGYVTWSLAWYEHAYWGFVNNRRFNLAIKYYSLFEVQCTPKSVNISTITEYHVVFYMKQHLKLPELWLRFIALYSNTNTGLLSIQLSIIWKPFRRTFKVCRLKEFFLIYGNVT